MSSKLDKLKEAVDYFKREASAKTPRGRSMIGFRNGSTITSIDDPIQPDFDAMRFPIIRANEAAAQSALGSIRSTSTGSGIMLDQLSVASRNLDRQMWMQVQDGAGTRVWQEEMEINFGVQDTRGDSKMAPLPEAKLVAAEAVGDISGGAPDSYQEMCKLLGYWPAKLLDKVLPKFAKTFMRKNEFVVYDTDAVERYLTSRCRHAEFKAHQQGDRNMFGGLTSYRWTWKPLREQDTSNGVRALFTEVVPEEVLSVMQKVEQAWAEQTKDTPMEPAKAHFEATEIYRDPDPFLRVTFKRPGAEAKASFVIAHWDEPGFSITK